LIIYIYKLLLKKNFSSSYQQLMRRTV